MSDYGLKNSYQGINFILRNPSNWSGQSDDTYAAFGKFASTIEETEDGNRITIYFTRGGGTSLMTFKNKEQAMGDTVKTAGFSTWKKIHVIGTGNSKDRAESDVGLVNDYNLYAYPETYFTLDAAGKKAAKENYLIKNGQPNSNDFIVALSEDADLSLSYSIRSIVAPC